MVFKITGLDKLQNELEEASRAFEALDGEITTLRFDPTEPSSVERAIAEMERAVDSKLAPYQGNTIIATTAVQLKTKYRDHILERAVAARAKRGDDPVSQARGIDPDILGQIENTVTDLLQAESNTFERHIKKLSRLLHSPDLDGTTRKLVEGIDLDGWLQSGHGTQGGTFRSPKLEWPSEIEKELGIVVLLIDRFSENPSSAFIFSRTYYRNETNNVSSTLRNMTNQMIAPFARDYVDYIHRNTITEETTAGKPLREKPPAAAALPASATEQRAELLTLKPGIWGINVDLKEVGRRLRRCFKKS
jgi:hypothetical protein